MVVTDIACCRLLVLFWNEWWLSPLGWVLPKIPICAYQWRKTRTGSDRRGPSCPVFCLWQRVLVDIWVKRQSPRWPGLAFHLQPSVAERLPWARHLIVPFQVVFGGFYTTLYNFRLPGEMLMSEMWAGNESWHLCCIFSSRKAKMVTSPYSPRQGVQSSSCREQQWCRHTAGAPALPCSSECRAARRRLMGPFSPVIHCHLGKYILESKYM